MPTSRATTKTIVAPPSAVSSVAEFPPDLRGVVSPPCAGGPPPWVVGVFLLLVTASIAAAPSPPVTLTAADHADLMRVLTLNCDLLEYELRHKKGCQYDPARPRRHGCSCGLLRKCGELRAVLLLWQKRNP